MFWGYFLLAVMPVKAPSPVADSTRVQRYAAYRAHTILPESLRLLVKRHGKFLFEGLERGLRTQPEDLNEALIIAETQKITALIDQQAQFRTVIGQMGYVSGLLAIWSDPSIGQDVSVRRGFHHYLNRKLKRFLFVFDGYPRTLPDRTNLSGYLGNLKAQSSRYGDILRRDYQSVNNNPLHNFDERSGVFGVCSIYFSNLASTSAQLWYHAWKDASGDLTRTPFVK